MRSFFTFFAVLLFAAGYGQSNQAEYLEAKRQFSLENYQAAKLAFRDLTSDQTFGEYASFYYALSAYRNEEVKLALDMWKQMVMNNASWDQIDEVNYWLAHVSFEQQDYDKAFDFLKVLPTDLRELVVQQHVASLDVSELRKAYEQDPDNPQIASLLLGAMSQGSFGDRDIELITFLSEKFDLPASGSKSNLPEIFKEKYSIAVVLPFMFESIENPQPVLKNSIIWNLFQGMRLAKSDLSNEGIEVELFPYDTRKSGQITSQLVENGQLDEVDVIVGPLYSGPNSVISSYSVENEVTMINPLSSNSELIGDNPFAYLFMPSYETQGREAAKFVAKKYNDNKKTFVFYETARDSIVAKAYLDELERHGFFVVRFEQLSRESAQQLDFTEKYEVRLDHTFSREEIDSIQLIPGRLVKSKPLRNAQNGSLIKDEEGNVVNMLYEERFSVETDSIGHIFVATSSKSLANNFISLSEVRVDTIEIIGYNNWLDFSTISFKQLERLEITFINSTYFDRERSAYQEVEASFIDAIGREPDLYHLIGYELVYQLGNLLEKNGRYFQKGLNEYSLIEGRVMQGLKYGPFNDNQIVPMTQLKDLKLVNQVKVEKH